MRGVDGKIKFPDDDVDRFGMSCPECKQGCNSADFGGNEVCFHCDVCGLVECELDYDDSDFDLGED